MTLTISLSYLKTLPFDFQAAVQDFIKAKKDHLELEGVPAPSAPHYAVEAAVRRIAGSVSFSESGQPIPETQVPDDFVADYQIIDDTPPPPTIEERKAAVAQKINSEAIALRDQITPPLKAKLWNMQYADALAARTAERATDAHEATIEEYEKRMKLEQKISRHVAELESQLHDLPEDMIDVWKPAPFPEG